MLVPDDRVPFPAFFVKCKTKTEQRRFVAHFARNWARVQHERGYRGAVMVDIDDTLIDGNENVVNGFQFMKDVYTELGSLFPLHVVTARPDDDHLKCMDMLVKRGFCIPPDRLHMLPAHLYGKESVHVEDFKWKTCCAISDSHRGVVVRMGDKMWDVAHHASLHSSLFAHVDDKDCYVFLDPAQKGTASFKLPGI